MAKVKHMHKDEYMMQIHILDIIYIIMFIIEFIMRKLLAIKLLHEKKLDKVVLAVEAVDLAVDLHSVEEAVEAHLDKKIYICIFKVYN
jgi:hypothetical protein